MRYTEKQVRDAVDLRFELQGTITLRDFVAELGYPTTQTMSLWISLDPRPRDAEKPALRRYGVAALVGRYGPHFRAYISAACFKTSTSIRSLRFSRSSSRIRFCSGVRLSAARGEPVAFIDLTHLSTVLLPRPYSSMISRLGLPAL